MAITPADLSGVDEALARRIIGAARSIAPCIDSLDGEPKADAVAVLTGVAGEAAARGSRLVQTQRIGPASVSYTQVRSWFSDDDRAALRALCAAVSASSGGPVGEFPTARPIARVWPEDD